MSIQVTMPDSDKHRWAAARAEERTLWWEREEKLAAVFTEIINLGWANRGGVLSKYNVRLGERCRPFIFEDYEKVIEVFKSHGIKAFGRPTSRDGRHYDDTTRGTVTVFMDGSHWDVCMS